MIGHYSFSFYVLPYKPMKEQQKQFSIIYDEYVPKIYRFIYLKVSTREIAEDLSSDVFMRVWKEYTRKDIDNIQAFLYKVARNVLADHYRAPRVKVVSVEKVTTILLEDGSLEHNAEVSSDMEQIRKALLHLKDDYQNYVIWRYLDELSIPEIAQITGKSEPSVRVGVHRALRALKGHMVEK